MTAAGTILDLARARSLVEPDETPSVYTLQLVPGDFALIDAADGEQSAQFGDICCGIAPLAEGSVRFMGRDWARVPDDFAAALRGRIGRIFTNGGWVEFLDVAANILLPQLHHTRHDARELRDRAADLASHFGLPGLPLERPTDLSPRDLARAACVRAFIGDPVLLLLEHPVSGQFSDLKAAILDSIARARARGAAAIWLSRSELVLRDQAFPANQRWRLDATGLVPIGRNQ
jgi:phospholipid/cholesterol/gamma-HCH transport system ATP-binding protein